MYVELINQAYQRLLSNINHTDNNTDYFCKNCNLNLDCSFGQIQQCWDRVFRHKMMELMILTKFIVAKLHLTCIYVNMAINSLVKLLKA